MVFLWSLVNGSSSTAPFYVIFPIFLTTNLDHQLLFPSINIPRAHQVLSRSHYFTCTSPKERRKLLPQQKISWEGSLVYDLSHHISIFYFHHSSPQIPKVKHTQDRLTDSALNSQLIDKPHLHWNQSSVLLIYYFPFSDAWISQLGSRNIASGM